MMTQYVRDPRPAFWIPCASRDVGPDSPRGLVRGWDDRATARDTLRGWLRNPYSNRVGLHNPMGRGPGPSGQEKNNGAQWYGGEPWRREILEEEIGEWFGEDHSNTLEVYGSCSQWNPWTWEPGPHPELDPDNHLTVQRWLTTWWPWHTRCGAHRIWHDNSSADHKRPGFLRFATFARNSWSVILGMEALPTLRNHLGKINGIDREAWNETPALCTSQYALHPSRGPDFVRVHGPDAGQEGIILVTGHEIVNPDGTTRPLPYPGEVDAWRAAGWIVGTLALHRPDVFELVWGAHRIPGARLPRETPDG